jgi:hypothetical protein
LDFRIKRLKSPEGERMRPDSNLRRLFKAIVCPVVLGITFVLIAPALRAQTTDPCTPALPVGKATGCGILITVFSVDANGNAVNYSAADTGNGNPYDTGDFGGGDDWLIGIINQSGANLTAITLTTPTSASTGIFAFDNDGPCAFNRKDCFGGFGSYNGPDNTFTGISSNKRTGTVGFGNPIPSGGSTWFALEGTLQGNVVQQTNNFSTTSTTTVNLNNNSGQEIQQVFDYSDAGTVNSPLAHPQLVTTNNPFSTGTWPQYVAGTPWATTQCAQRAGNGGLCSLYINACFDTTSGVGLAQANDTYCPTVANPSSGNFIGLKDTWDPTTKPSITPGTTVSLIAFTPSSANIDELWTANTSPTNPVCTNVLAATGSSTVPTQCDISDALVAIYGDQTTTRGSKPKKSWNITAFNVAMLLSTVNAVAPTNSGLTCTPGLNDANPSSPTYGSPTFGAKIWNNGGCLLEFVVNPAQAPANNGFVAAPPATLTYGVGPTANPVPPNCNTNPCDAVGTNPNTNQPAAPWTFNTDIPLSSANLFGGDGQFTLHWYAQDMVGITERNVQLIPAGSNTPCNNPDNQSGLVPPCYNTSLFMAEVNIDSVAPTAPCTQSPASPVAGSGGWYNTNVVLSCTGSDDRSGIGTTAPSIAASYPIVPPATLPFTLQTTVAAGSAQANASTGSEQLCDLAHNCLTTGPQMFNIDEALPTIGSITFSPASGVYELGQQVTAAFSCADVGSGVATCLGTGGISSGGLIDTSSHGTGTYTFTVTASDKVGNQATPKSVNYTVGDFSVSVTPATQTIPSGHQAQFTITVTPSANLTGTVTLGCSGNPTNTTCSITPSSINLGAAPVTSTVTLSANKSVIHGTWTLTFKGTLAGITRSTMSTLTIK